jgi:glycosyltransferase involved in cell wall biosynthesis
LAGGWPRIGAELGHEDFHFPSTWQLLDLLRQKPDVVHAHNLHGGYFDLRILPWLSQQVPFIINLRDAWLLSGHCAHSFECDRWKAGCGHCPDLSIYPAIKRDATAYNWKRKQSIYARSRLYVTAPSEWLIEKVKQSMLHSVQTRVIPNGVNLNIFRPADRRMARTNLGLPPELKIVLFVANNARRSRWRDYAAMEAAVARVANNTDTELIFLCLGETGNERSFGKVRIFYAPFEYDPERVCLYYQASDIYIHAAKADTFPRAIIEALACGVPVVATAVGGIPEQIVDGVTGFLVSPGDPASMAARIEQLLVDDELRRSFSEAAARDAKHRFSLTRQTDGFITWYQEIIEKPNVSKSHVAS